MQKSYIETTMHTRSGETMIAVQLAPGLTNDRLRDVREAVRSAVKPFQTAGEVDGTVLLCEQPGIVITNVVNELPPCPPSPTQEQSAAQMLRFAANQIEERAAVRDLPGGERSMKRTVDAFNAMFGTALSESQGWQFMELLKMARASAGAYHADDYIDKIGYAALDAEAAARCNS